MDKLWAGVTSSEELNNGDETVRQILRFELQRDLTWKYIHREKFPNDSWNYGKFVYSDQKRFSFKVFNEKQIFTFTLNYKNNYPIPNTNTKAPARLGLGTANFNGKFTPK